jgi:APA family basic amino acid/polyamine antiporter
VRDPARTIPRAISIALSGVVIVYALIGIVVLLVLGGDAIGTSAPLAEVVRAAGLPALAPVVRVTAAAAALGALLALITGIGRTSLAMAREGDLPRVLAAVDPRRQVPRRAEITIGLVVILVVLLADLRGAIGFSSFGVLLYYLLANLAALRQRGDARRYPRALQVVGAIGCVALVSTLPPLASLIGVGVLLVGFAGRSVALRLRPGSGR